MTPARSRSNTYDVLVQLSEAGGRLRLRDLVDRVLLSQPGLSRKVARMEDEGLVERLPDPHDGRGVLVRMTRSGRAALRSAAVVHIAGVEREFTSRISDEEAATLAKVFARLLDHDGETGVRNRPAGSLWRRDATRVTLVVLGGTTRRRLSGPSGSGNMRVHGNAATSHTLFLEVLMPTVTVSNVLTLPRVPSPDPAVAVSRPIAQHHHVHPRFRG